MAIPVSLQTLGLFTIVGISGTRLSFFSTLIYIIIGAVGVPVFAGFKGGIGVILGPTGGFILGFIPAVIVSGILIKKLPSKKWAKFVSFISGQLVCYVSGALWYTFAFSGDSVTITQAISVCIIPFLIPDLIKITVSVFLSDSINGILKKQNIDIK